MSLYTASKREWAQLDRAMTEGRQVAPDFYETHCCGCDGPLEGDGACLACMTPSDRIARNARHVAAVEARRKELAQ